MREWAPGRCEGPSQSVPKRRKRVSRYRVELAVRGSGSCWAWVSPPPNWLPGAAQRGSATRRHAISGFRNARKRNESARGGTVCPARRCVCCGCPALLIISQKVALRLLLRCTAPPQLAVATTPQSRTRIDGFWWMCPAMGLGRREKTSVYSPCIL